jgi:hydrogenase maturation protein HypF
MMPDINTIKRHCIVGEAEIEWLESRERPIIILPRRPESNIVDEIAPNQKNIGVMLPYTPLHYLLFADWDGSKSHVTDGLLPLVLVMTSGNLSEEPIATENIDARQRLSALADAFLMHDRPIRTRCDDSVAQIFYTDGSGEISKSNQLANITILRRSRGYAPTPLNIPWEGKPLLATGAELKNSFCLTRDQYAFLSHHIGDMENYETLLSFEDSIAHFERVFKINPEALAYDLHPNYLATRYALERADSYDLPAIGVQHHHAHIAACMTEHGLSSDQPVIGVAFDGTGYGEDGAIWGGEFLIADYANYTRYAHLSNAPLPGGDVAIRKPARIALAYLWHAGLDWDTYLAPLAFFSSNELVALQSQLENNINTPMTSSMGRLFDAVAALLNVRQQVNYEAQAAIELEALVNLSEKMAYSFDNIHVGANPAYKASHHTPIQAMQIDPKPMFSEIISDLHDGVNIGKLSARFHNGLAAMVNDVCVSMRSYSGINQVALSGGVWQNMVLLKRTVALLNAAKFEVMFHSSIPPNDGGLALGQAAIAAHRLNNDQ